MYPGPFLKPRQERYELALAVIATLAVVLILPGCNVRDVELVPVEGYVTLDGKPPPGPGTLYFTPTEALGGEPMRPARAIFAEDGHFVARAFDDAKGLIPGKYRVGIHCWEVEPTIDGPPAQSYIPQKYMSAGTSGLEFVIEPGSRSVDWNAELVSE